MLLAYYYTPAKRGQIQNNCKTDAVKGGVGNCGEMSKSQLTCPAEIASLTSVFMPGAMR